MSDLKTSLELLEKWIHGNGWEGYDPYDIKSIKLLLPLQRNKITFTLTSIILNRFPMALRKIFQIKKQINNKAMALFAQGYFSHFVATQDEYYLDKALFCLEWLTKNYSKGYSGYCWGYPFDWQSLILIPKRTPSSVVSSIALKSFLTAFELTSNERYLEIADSCCRFIANDLNKDEVDDTKLCFSYTPLDDFHVHNANLYCSSSLLRTYNYTKNNKYKDLGLRALNFTMSYQNGDGSWYYWAPPNKLNFYIDNYHTGFILECINTCKKVLGDSFKYVEELKKGISYYADNMFLDNGAAKLTKKSIYPIDIHSCAQGIITFSELADLYPESINRAQKIAHWTLSNMQDHDGYFYYRFNKNYINKIPYIRWGQAWMYHALANLYKKLK